ncbi:hypothetical protein [Cytobacillus sp. FSL H8-0458]|uniref:hypothetical protein n=1 Tax=Cytobacillus sp. FSL H8-0458 TaxID=2975346 RepID=UPI0030FA5F2E
MKKKNKEFFMNFLTGKKNNLNRINPNDIFALDLYRESNKESINDVFNNYKEEIRKLVNSHFAQNIVGRITDLLHDENPQSFFLELEKIHQENLGSSHMSEDIIRGFNGLIELGQKAATEGIVKYISDYELIYRRIISKNILDKYVYIKSKLLEKIYQALTNSTFYNKEVKGEFYLTKLTIKLGARVTISSSDFHTGKVKLSPQKRLIQAKVLLEENLFQGMLHVNLIWGAVKYWFQRSTESSKDEKIRDTISMEIDDLSPTIADNLISFYKDEEEVC